MPASRTAKFALIWVNLAMNMKVSIRVFPAGKIMVTIATVEIWRASIFFFLVC